VRIVLTGDYRRDEFDRPLAEMSQAAEIALVDGLQAAADWLKGGTPADLVVVAQARPGQFSALQIEAIRRAAPLAPIVALLGSWCEGETRSGFPWPGVTRVYWHQWGGRFGREIEKLSRGEPGELSQPLTATAEERLLWLDGERDAQSKRIVAVVSGNSEMRAWLAGVCGTWGLSVITFRRPPAEPVGGISLVLWDAGPTISGAIEAFPGGLSQFPAARAVVLADFPRAEDVECFLTSGAAAVLSKPLMLNDLAGALDSRTFLGGQPKAPF
jgi:hypothetical protein